MRDSPIVCTYRYTAHRITGACAEFEIEVGPFLSRDQAEAAVVREVRKHIVVHDELCFTHKATEYVEAELVETLKTVANQILNDTVVAELVEIGSPV